MRSPLSVRGALLTVAAGLVGIGAGYGSASLRTEVPASFSVAPLPATKPAFPRDPKIVVVPDSDFPALQRNLPAHAVRVGQKPFALNLQIPDNWVLNTRTYGEWRFYPPPGVPTTPDSPTLNTYFMRVSIIANLYKPVGQALQDRIAALRGASGVKDFTVETVSSDTLIATYVADEHKRVTMERFIDAPSAPGQAYAAIAVVGREADRNGMSSLLENVTDSAIRSLAAPKKSPGAGAGAAALSSTASPDSLASDSPGDSPSTDPSPSTP